jgi:hypothetical protein
VIKFLSKCAFDTYDLMSLTACLKIGNYAILMPLLSSRLRFAFRTIIKVVIITTSSEFCDGLYREL